VVIAGPAACGKLENVRVISWGLLNALSLPPPSTLALCRATAVWIANFNSSCTMQAVGEVIQEWGAGFAFPKGTSDAYLGAWNQDILKIKQSTNLGDVFKVRLGLVCA
jgi:hypothetical protein